MSDEKFELTGGLSDASQYIRALYTSAGKLSDEAVCAGIQEVTEKRISEIRSTMTQVSVAGKSYFVSGEGNDENDGLSPETAWRTPDRVSTADELCYGDAVFFRRGDLFRGSFDARSGITYSAYGEGEKPRIYGSDRNAAAASLWKETDITHIWEYENAGMADIGSVVFDGRTFARKVYLTAPGDDGKIRDAKTGAEFSDYRDLVEDMTFYHDYRNSGKLYLRCERGNPGTLAGSIEMAKKQCTIRVRSCNNVTVDNICFAHTNFGVSTDTCNNLTVQNCEFNWIGGCLMREADKEQGRENPTAYGNGIEIFGGAENFTVRNNYFYQVFDAAATNQYGKRPDDYGYKNIRYLDNVMEYCVYAVEIFLGYSTLEGVIRKNEDTYIENNIMRMGGGFGHIQRFNPDCTSLIRNGLIVKQTENYIVRNNILDRSEKRLVRTVLGVPDDGGSMAQYYDNLYVQKRGEQVFERAGKVYFAENDMPQKIAETGSEHGAKFIFVEELGF